MDFSPAFRSKVLETGVRTAFTAPVLEIRAGARPASPEDATQGNLLCRVTLPATGYFSAATGGVVSLAGSWSGTAQTAGDAGWFRLRDGSDTGAISTTAIRIDGTVTDTVGDLVLGTLTLAVNDVVDVTAFSIALSASAMIVRATGVEL